MYSLPFQMSIVYFPIGPLAIISSRVGNNTVVRGLPPLNDLWHLLPLQSKKTPK